MTQKPIIIVGGGIGGLAAALACAKAGREALVLERAAAFDEVGAGLQIGPNAVRALEALGAWEDVSEIASAPPAILMHDARSGKLVRRLELGEAFSTRFGAPYRVAHRADLHAALLACARRSPRIHIANGQDIDGLEQDDRSVNVTTIENVLHGGDMLIAADGMNSVLRQKLWPDSAAVFAGQVLYRALIAMPHNIADAACVQLWMGPGYHVVHYPVGNPARLNVVCVAHGKQTPLGIAELACRALRTLLRSVTDWLPWDAKFVPPLTSWHKGRVHLLGDAAHGTVPFFAQGAAMALEDAALLLALLRSNLQVSFDQRMDRTRSVHRASVRQGKIYGASGPIAAGRNVVLRLLPENALHAQLAWLYGH